MANRYFRQFMLTAEPSVVKLYARVTFAAAGAPTLDAVNSKMVKSVTRTGAGNYTFAFGTSGIQANDTYNRILAAQATFLIAGGVPAAPQMTAKVNAVQAAGTLSVQFNSAAGAAADPGNGEEVWIEFTFKNSTAP